MRKKLPVGIQVYGLRDLLENTPEQFPAVMKQVKELKKWYPDSWLHRFLRWGKRTVFKILRLDRRER